MKTVLVFMPIARMQGIAELMISKGYPACLPAAIIENGTLENQRVIHGTLENMATMDIIPAIFNVAAPIVGAIASVVTSQPAPFSDILTTTDAPLQSPFLSTQSSSGILSS
ncbi:hypothetical protein BC830DRAFT_1175866 [Chytriomyces sp. MP71]|nr:hypothetical protein BC830DRAFT_1175866 [Chytriomyces sp. MP71]